MSNERRPWGRLFYWLLLVGVALAQTLGTTTIHDVVYRADGTPAGGTLLISWPAFSTASGQAVAAGTTTATLASGGWLTVQLAPNAGATPANTVYTVVYPL
jgi:trimeric autotransporter adhesin